MLQAVTRLRTADLKKGAFMRPTILTDVNNKMCVAQEEIFGPVVCFIPFKDEEEVIRMANDSEYGLGGAVWTHDINRAFRVARSVETGRMWVNNYNNLPAHAPFGGYKKIRYWPRDTQDYTGALHPEKEYLYQPDGRQGWDVLIGDEALPHAPLPFLKERKPKNFIDRNKRVISIIRIDNLLVFFVKRFQRDLSPLAEARRRSLRVRPGLCI